MVSRTRRTSKLGRARSAAGLRIAFGVAAGCLLAVGAAMGILGAEPAVGAAKHPSPISWATEGFNAKRTDYDGRESTIGPANAHHLHKLGSAEGEKQLPVITCVAARHWTAKGDRVAAADHR